MTHPGARSWNSLDRIRTATLVLLIPHTVITHQTFLHTLKIWEIFLKLPPFPSWKGRWQAFLLLCLPPETPPAPSQDDSSFDPRSAWITVRSGLGFWADPSDRLQTSSLASIEELLLSSREAGGSFTLLPLFSFVPINSHVLSGVLLLKPYRQVDGVSFFLFLGCWI